MTNNFPAFALQLDCIIFGLQKYGGISNYWARLIDSILREDRYQLDLILPKNIIFREFNPTWLKSRHVQKETLAAQLTRYLSCANTQTNDIFHTSYYRLPSRKPRRYVATAYDFIYERYRPGPAKWVHTIQKRRCLERADVISCISSFTRDDILQVFPKIDSRRLHVVPLGVDTGTFFPDAQPTDAGLQSTVLFVGHRGGYKRFDLAVDAMRPLPRQFILGIVGPPLGTEERARLDAVVPGRWTHFGTVSSSRLRELYSSVYALIFPSNCEGFGLPVLEAMSCGCPVVAANRASLPEVGGTAALYAKEQRSDCYSEALMQLENTSLRKQLIAEGASRAAQFSWAETTRRTQALYALSL